MGSPAADQLIEQAQHALKRLCDAQPTTDDALAAIKGITDAWPKRPFRIGIGGEDPAMRATLLDVACGGGVLNGRPAGAAPLRVRRGAKTRYRIVRDDAKPEETLLPPRPASTVDPIELARREVESRELELGALEVGLPALVRGAPQWWEVWLWPLYWWHKFRAKAKLAARERATAALETARRKAEEIAGKPYDALADDRPRLARFFAGMGAARDATEIEIEVALGPLAEGIELVELAGAARAAAVVDAVLIAAPGGVLAPVSGGTPVRVGDPEQVIRALPGFLVHARALNLARRARDRLDAARLALDRVLDRAETDFATRVSRLEHLRVQDADGLRTQQLAKLRPQIFSHVGAVMEHASTHLGAELVQLEQTWTAKVDRAAARDQLKAAVTQIDTEWPTNAQRIAEEVRVLVTGGIAGSAHDLYEELVAPLRALRFVDKTKRPAPVLPKIAILPSLSNPSIAKRGGAADWFAGIFRSFESRRGETVDKTKQRADHVRVVARAELLDAEPVLHAALSDALAGELTAAITRHSAWIDSELEKERAAIKRERAGLERLQHVRDRAHRDSRDLADKISKLEGELPGTAAASAAARLSVGSIPRPSETPA